MLKERTYNTIKVLSIGRMIASFQRSLKKSKNSKETYPLAA